MSRHEKLLEESKRRAASLTSLIDVLGRSVDAEDIQAAALVPLAHVASQAVFNLAVMALIKLDCMAAILAGRAPEELVSVFANVPWPEPEPAPNMGPTAQPDLAALEPPPSATVAQEGDLP